MNIKNKAHEIIDIFVNAQSYDYETCFEMVKNAQQIINTLAWVAADERLPDHHDKVKVLYSNDLSGEGFCKSVNGNREWDIGSLSLKVVGWRELQ